jgi:hypothetical protein
MSGKATDVVPAPPPQSPKKAKSSHWDKAKSKRRASTILMLRVKQAKEAMEKEMLTEAETIEKEKVGLKFAHIMYILKQQRKNKEYFDLIVFCVYVMIYVFILTTNRAAYAANSLNCGIKDVLINEAFNEASPGGSPYEDTRTYYDTVNFQEMWMWINGPFMDVLYQEEDMIGKPYGTYIHGSNKTRRIILGQTQLLGSIMVRHLRTEPVVKSIYEGGEIYKTYPYYEDYFPEPKNPVKNGTYDKRYGTYIGDKSLSNLNGVTTGFYTYVVYGRNAWVTFLSRDKTNATLQLQELQRNGMADEGTGIVSLDFSAVNPSINSITSVRIIFEMTSTGYMRHKAWLWTVPVNFYTTNFQLFRGFLECVFVLGLFCYTAGELIELYQIGPKLYFNSTFNRVEVINLGLFWYNVGSYVWFMYNWNYTVDFDDETTDLYGWTMYYNSNTRMAAFNTLICFLKVFKYLQVSPRFNLLWATMSYASKDLTSFMAVWLLFMFGYCTVGILVYGPDTYDFATYVNAFTTLFKVLLGDFDYDELERASPIMTPIFFISFVILVFFVTINMMVAIIIKGFERAKQLQSETKHRIIRVPYVHDAFSEFAYTTVLRFKALLGWVNVPIEALSHHHAVHLLADPKNRKAMEDGAVLRASGNEAAANDLNPELQAKFKKATAKERSLRQVRRKQTQKIVIKARKTHAQQKLEIWQEHLVAARRLKKAFAQCKSIQKAYTRLMKLEAQIPRKVFDKVLEQKDLATVLGDEELARQAIIDFTFLESGAHHLDDDGEFGDDDHSDSAHIVETSVDVKMMRSQVSKMKSDISLIKKIVVSQSVESKIQM